MRINLLDLKPFVRYRILMTEHNQQTPWCGGFNPRCWYWFDKDGVQWATYNVNHPQMIGRKQTDLEIDVSLQDPLNLI